jgi:DNA topoisomerase VI subunit B
MAPAATDASADDDSAALMRGRPGKKTWGAARGPPGAGARATTSADGALTADRAAGYEASSSERRANAEEREMARKKAAVEEEVEAVDERRMPRQREIAVSEFFSKNRHLLGFDSPQKAMLTAVREAVDNALDACEEARIPPDIVVELTELAENRYKVRIEDNGPGIPKSEMGKIFAKLLYGSKFHRLKQSRGQQGIGISAAVMYAQMTTGEPADIVSKMKGGRPNHVRLFIDTAKNQPKIETEGLHDSDWWKQKASGTSIELVMTAQMKGGRHGIEAYLKQTALANPHARILFRTHKLATRAQLEKGAPPSSTETLDLPRVVQELPKEPVEIKPHPHGVELGTLQRMFADAGKMKIGAFLTTAFSRVPGPIAKEILVNAGVSENAEAGKLSRADGEGIYKAIQTQKLMAPPTNCLSPIGEDALIKGLFALFGDIENLAEEEEEVLVLGKPRPGVATAPGDGAESAPVGEGKAEGGAAPKREGKGAAGAAKGGHGEDKKLPGKKVEAQLALFQRALVTTPPTPAKDGAAGDGDATGATGTTGATAARARIEQDEEGAQVLAVGENMFVTAVTRPPAIYRGNPFQVECGILYSKELAGDELAKVFRFANRVPLLYQASACAMTKAVVSAPWRSYEVQQSRGALPTGPLVILVHIASAWVPYTSESKEAIAHYPEVLKEMRLAVMEAGRRLQRFLRRRKRDADEQKKKDYITRYLDPIGEALRDILGLSTEETREAVDNLKIVLEKSRLAGEENKRARTKKPRSGGAAGASA